MRRLPGLKIFAKKKEFRSVKRLPLCYNQVCISIATQIDYAPLPPQNSIRKLILSPKFSQRFVFLRNILKVADVKISEVVQNTKLLLVQSGTNFHLKMQKKKKMIKHEAQRDSPHCLLFDFFPFLFPLCFHFWHKCHCICHQHIPCETSHEDLNQSL